MKATLTLSSLLGITAILSPFVLGMPRETPAWSQQPAAESKLAHVGAGGRLVYAPYDDRGDTLPDFSHCGYGGGGVALPQAPTRETVEPVAGAGDDLPRIQQAIDTVSALPLGPDGLRGAILLKRGQYRLSGTLHIAASGIVLRGEGDSPGGTVLLSTAREKKPLIDVRAPEANTRHDDRTVRISDSYVPVGARTLHVESSTDLHIGDTILVRRHGNAAWIHTMGMDHIAPRAADPGGTKQWTPFSLDFDRVITAIDGDRITLDAPIACAIDTEWGGGDIAPYTNHRIENVGIENLYAECIFDKTKTSTEGMTGGKPYYSDEAHADYAVAFDNIQNAWARHIATRYLQAVALMARGAKWVTIEDSSSIDPVSIITGERRYTYNISGQLCLVQRCTARDARHAFIVGDSHVPGPNVFLDCRAENSHNTSEPHQRWSVGGLYDNVSAPMAIQDRQWMGTGHGWAGGNYVVWNSTGSLICQQPPTAQNFAIGFVGKREPGAFERPSGWWESFGTPVAPRSLYLQQLQDRTGASGK